MKRAIFLDRDGTIIEDVKYCSSVEEIEILPTVPEAIKLLNQRFLVIIITNQSGINRGLFDEAMLSKIHDQIELRLMPYSAYIDAIYYCPHMPNEFCKCRKPGIELFERAAREKHIDLSRSFVVGDRQMDTDAARAIGAKVVHVTTGPESVSFLDHKMPDHISVSLLEAAKWIMEDSDDSRISE